MNTKRDTPQGKPKNPPSASKYRTPTTTLNSTVQRKDTASACKPLRSSSAASLSMLVPNIKTNLHVAPVVDYELECDLAYSDYLQALLKKEIAEKVIKQHEEDMKGQIIIQRENLHKGKLALVKVNQEIAELEKLDKISELITVLSDNFTQFFASSDNIDLEDTLPQLLALLNAFANRLTVKNVKKLDKQEDFDRLNAVVKQCVVVFEKMNLDVKNIEEVNHLATIMKKYQENLDRLIQKQKFISNLQKKEVYKLFKSISDMMAEKEKTSMQPKN